MLTSVINKVSTGATSVWEYFTEERTNREEFTLEIILPGIFVFLFIVLPVLLMVLWSFWTYDTGAGRFVMEFTLQNYISFVSEGRYPAVVRTLQNALVTVFFTNILAYPAAYAIYRFIDEDRQLPVLMILVIPFIINRLLRIWALTFLLSNGGAINQFLFFMEPISVWLYTSWSVYLGLILNSLPIAIMLIWLSLGRINEDFLQASYDLGASPFYTFRRVTLPLSKTGLAASSMLIFVFVMGTTAIPSFMGGPASQTTGSMISSLFRVLRLDLAGATAIITLVIIFLVLTIGQYFGDVLTVFEEIES